MRANRLVLAAVLSEIQALMVSFAETNGKYPEMHINEGIGAYIEGNEDDKSGDKTWAHLIADFSSVGTLDNEAAPKARTHFSVVSEIPSETRNLSSSTQEN